MSIGQKLVAYIKHARVELLLLLCIIIVDLATKWIVSSALNLHERREVIPNFFYILYTVNHNAAFGSDFGLSNVLGAGGVRVFFICFTVIFVAFFFVLLYLWRDRRPFVRYTLAMLIAGALGNLYDRMLYGYVRDFIQIVFFGADLPLLGRDFAIFNIADTAVFFGVIGMLIYMLFMSDKDTKRIKAAVAKDQEHKNADKADSTDDKGEQ
jgi:signal peptidase II